MLYRLQSIHNFVNSPFSSTPLFDAPPANPREYPHKTYAGRTMWTQSMSVRQTDGRTNRIRLRWLRRLGHWCIAVQFYRNSHSPSTDMPCDFRTALIPTLVFWPLSGFRPRWECRFSMLFSPASSKTNSSGIGSVSLKVQAYQLIDLTSYLNLLVRERSALATLIFTSCVCLS